MFFCQWKHISILLIKAKQRYISFLLLYFPLHMTISFPGLWSSLVAQMVKNLPAKRETRVRSLGWEDPLAKGNGSSLWYSCLENPMDRGAWRATVHAVAKSWTWLSD